MKKRVLAQVAERLKRRETALRERFIRPISTISQWDSRALDFAGAYISLVHAEAEAALEDAVRLTLTNARTSSERWRPHAVLVNCSVFFQSEVSARLSRIDLCPQRAVLEGDPLRLVEAWDRLGVGQYFQNRLEDNHGAGIQYVENLLHPLGVAVSPKAFRRVEGRGVRQVAQLASSQTTELTEFVVLRGKAVHAGTADFAEQLRNETPQALTVKGQASVAFVSSLASLLSRRAW